jgi:thioredoxin reductase (NADPH)
VLRSTLSDGTVLCSRSVLCATSVEWRRLDVEGMDRLIHSCVYYASG